MIIIQKVATDIFRETAPALLVKVLIEVRHILYCGEQHLKVLTFANTFASFEGAGI